MDFVTLSICCLPNNKETVCFMSIRCISQRKKKHEIICQSIGFKKFKKLTKEPTVNETVVLSMALPNTPTFEN